MEQFKEQISKEKEQGTGIGRTVIVAVIWGLYITKSKRVKTTFIED